MAQSDADPLQTLQGLIREGRLEQARALAQRLTTGAPSPVPFLMLAQVHSLAGEPDGVLAALEAGRRRFPESRDILINLGQALMASRRFDEASAHYDALVRRNPSDGDALLGLAVSLGQGSTPDRALEIFERLIRAHPGRADLHYNAGLAAKAAERTEAAERYYRQAIDRQPGLAVAHHNLGNLLLDEGRTREAFAAYRDGFLARRARGANPGDPEIRVTSAAKLRHDLEQLEFLRGIDRLAPPDLALIDGYRAVLQEVEEQGAGRVALRDDQIDRLGGSYLRIVHLEPGDEIAGPVLNPDLDVRSVTRRYFDGGMEFAVVDDVLSAEAIAALRRYMNEGSIWHKWKFANENGYVGSMLSDGFASPLLAQISEALRETFPDIFRHHRIRQSWAFKYSERIAGVPIHADSAAVNVNLYTTPDEANVDPETGGIVVWNVAAPLDWDFSTLNTDEGALERVITERGAEPTRVVHRQNRIAMFDSDLVHRTDDLHFKPGYLNRRINVTMLYGQRHDAEAHASQE